MFYGKFKALCDERGISCKKAAEDMGPNGSTPCKWKKEGSTPKVETLEKVAAYFNVTLGDLLDNEKDGDTELDMVQLRSLSIAKLIRGQRMLFRDMKNVKILSVCTAVALLLFMVAVILGGLL